MVRATGRCVCVPCVWIGLLFDRSVSALYLRIFVGSRLRENDVAKRDQSRENYKPGKTSARGACGARRGLFHRGRTLRWDREKRWIEAVAATFRMKKLA